MIGTIERSAAERVHYCIILFPMIIQAAKKTQRV